MLRWALTFVTLAGLAMIATHMSWANKPIWDRPAHEVRR